MRDSRSDDAGCGAILNGLVNARECFDAIFLRELFRNFSADVINAREIHLLRSGEIGVQARVFFSKRTGPKYHDAGQS